jgi:hypothetical protein
MAGRSRTRDRGVSRPGRRENRPAGFEEEVLRDWRPYSLAALIVLLLAVLQVSLIVRIDNTNLGTTNGLWKSVAVRTWELGSSHVGDSGGLLYIPAYGLMARAIPDEAVSYGVRPATPTFRKMAMTNAVFGALATGAVFLLSFHLLGSVSLALVVTAAHAGTGFVLLNSLNSEDVIPAYAFFAMAAYAFVWHALSRKLAPLILSGLLVALVALFHWTLMPPALAAFGIVELVLVLRRKAPPASLLIFPLAFFVGIVLFVGAVHVYRPASPIWFLEVLYPAKAKPSGWLGFGSNKAIYALMGMGNYFSGAQNVTDYHGELANAERIRFLVVSWVYLAVTAGACLFALARSAVPLALRAIAGLGLAVFLAGQLEHLYSQPQDPQSQIQPMFVTVAGLIVIVGLLRDRLPGKRLRLAALAVSGVFLLNGAVNVSLFLRESGADSKAVSAARELGRILRSRRVVLVSNGMEGWNAWLLLEVYGGDRRAYLRNNIHLFSVFTRRQGISGQEAANIMKKRIEAALGAGHEVAAADLWTRPTVEFTRAMTTLVNVDTAAAFDDALRGAFQTGASLDTPVGRIVELLPKAMVHEQRRVAVAR